MKNQLSLFLLILFGSILVGTSASLAKPRLNWVEKQVDPSKKTFLFFDVHEEIGTVEMQITLEGPNPKGLMVDIFTVDGFTDVTELRDYGTLQIQGTTEGEDYTLDTTMLYWSPGETGTQPVLIDIKDDSQFEASGVEWFNIFLAPHCEGKRVNGECVCVKACEDHQNDFDLMGDSVQTIWIIERDDVSSEISVDLDGDGDIDIVDRNIFKNTWKEAEKADEMKAKSAGLTAFTLDWSSEPKGIRP